MRCSRSTTDRSDRPRDRRGDQLGHHHRRRLNARGRRDGLAGDGAPHRTRRAGLRRPAPAGAVDRRHLRRVLDRMGLIQIDSVNVLVRSQELPLFARLGPHPRTLIGDATQAGELFEYWVHEASHVDMAHYHLHRWQMAGDHKWGRYWTLTERRPGSSRRCTSGSSTTVRSPRAISPSGSARRARGGTGTTARSPSSTSSGTARSRRPAGPATSPASTTSPSG